MNDEEGEGFEVLEEEVFEVKQTSLFYTQAPDHYEQNPQSKKLNLRSVSEQSIHFWWKDPSFSEAIENVDYEAAERMNTTDSG